MAGSPLTKQAIEDQIPDHGTCDVTTISPLLKIILNGFAMQVMPFK